MVVYLEDEQKYKRLQVPEVFLTLTTTLRLAVTLMISALQRPTNTKDMSHLDLTCKAPKLGFSPRYLVHSTDHFKFTIRNSLTDMSNIVHYSYATIPVVGDLSPLWSRSYPTMHLDCVAAVDRHDTDAWSQERKVHGTGPNAVAVSPSLGSNGTIPDGFIPNNVTKSSFALMEPQTEWVWAVERCSTGGFCEDTGIHRDDWTSLVAAGSGTPSVRPYGAIGPCSCKGLSGDRCQAGEILVHCGITNVSGTLPAGPAVVGCGEHAPSATADSLFAGGNEILITALTNWTSEWVHTLVIQPYLQGSFHFRYQGKPSKASTLVASRIRRVLTAVENPVQVVIHVLWFIGALTRNCAHDNTLFLSVPIFRYLHNNGTFLVEEFMFRIFVTCAMISDKTVNDITLSTNTWNHLTRIPQVVLNATEKYTLSCLKWNVVMSQVQWQDALIYLRSCIKMSTGFDPFSYEETSPSGIMARCLDGLINLSHVDDSETVTSQPQDVYAQVEILSPQSTQRLTHREAFHTAEWCPEHDPVVNHKPRTIGIAPGADQNSSGPKVGTTAKDLLDSILGSSGVPDLAHLAQPAGTSFCGSFGVMGARLAHTIRIASACQSTSWVPSHG